MWELRPAQLLSPAGSLNEYALPRGSDEEIPKAWLWPTIGNVQEIEYPTCIHHGDLEPALGRSVAQGIRRSHFGKESLELVRLVLHVTYQLNVQPDGL